MGQELLAIMLRPCYRGGGIAVSVIPTPPALLVHAKSVLSATGRVPLVPYALQRQFAGNSHFPENSQMGLLNRKKCAIGLDIGSSSVKLMELEHDAKAGASIASAAMQGANTRRPPPGAPAPAAA